MFSSGRRRVRARTSRAKIAGKKKPTASLSSLAEKMKKTGVQPGKTWQDDIEGRADALLMERQNQ